MKLSFIMQTYLGDYPGSRENSVDKFHRAVKSVMNQQKANWELIIVSDGCKLTKDIYYEHYENVDNIKFAYVEKKISTLMYSDKKDKIYYRGLPRQVGKVMSTGDWVGYMDSDDFLVKDATVKLEDFLSKIQDYNKITGKNVNFLFNNQIIEHENYLPIIQMTYKKHGLVPGIPMIDGEPFEIEGLPDKWIVSKNYKTFGMGTVWMWHTNDFNGAKWEDIKSENTSEDMLFANKVLESPELKKRVGMMEVAYYVRCHHSKLWDV